MPDRVSSTCTAPRDAEKELPAAPDCAPASTSDGTVIDSAPACAATVVVVVSAVVVVVSSVVVVVVGAVVVVVVVVVGMVGIVGSIWAVAGAATPRAAVRKPMRTMARRGTSPLSVIGVDLARST